MHVCATVSVHGDSIGGAPPVHSSRLVVDQVFSAPEKFKLTSSKLGPPADVYSVGALVTYALSGANPRSGPRRGDIRTGMRVLVENPYLIFYEIVPDTDSGPIEKVEIVRVDGRRDLPRLF